MSGNTSVTITAVDGIPVIQPGDDLGHIIHDALAANGQHLADGDVLCVASKIVSAAEDRTLLLADIQPSELARQLHSQIPRKDVRILQVILDQIQDLTGDRITISDNYIGGWLPNGLMLTSAGVDKSGPDAVVLLPENPDASAARIATALRSASDCRIGVIITDSDGRPDKRGATQVAIGVHGIPPLRTDHGEETLCDMLAAAAAIVMGQRGTGRPVAIIRGVDYAYDPNTQISHALHDANALSAATEALEVDVVERPRAVCLCGSLRFEPLFQSERRRLTSLGVIVLGPEATSEELTPSRRAALAELHLRRIDLADEVRVVSKGGYVGSATRREVEYARNRHKVISWIEPNLDL